MHKALALWLNSGMDIFNMIKLAGPVVAAVTQVPWERMQKPERLPSVLDSLPPEILQQSAIVQQVSASVPAPSREDDTAPCETCEASVTPEMYQRARTLAEQVKAGEITREDAVQQLRQSVAPPATSFVGGVTNEETLAYQVDHLLDELNLIETHFAEGGRIAGKPCDCIAKAARRIKAYAQETIPIAARQGKDASLYREIEQWAIGIQGIGDEVAVASGEYDQRFIEECGNASNLRKTLSKAHSISSAS